MLEQPWQRIARHTMRSGEAFAGLSRATSDANAAPRTPRLSALGSSIVRAEIEVSLTPN